MSKFRDDFASIDATYWASDLGTGATATAAGSLLTLAGGTGAALVYYKSELDLTKTQSFRYLLRRSVGTGANFASAAILDTEGAGVPTLALASNNANARVHAPFCTVQTVAKL